MWQSSIFFHSLSPSSLFNYLCSWQRWMPWTREREKNCVPENSRLTFFLLQLHSHNLLLNFAHVEHRKITSMDVLFNCTVPHLWERKENRVVAQKNCSKRFIAYWTDKRRPLFVSIHANETKRIPNRGEKKTHQFRKNRFMSWRIQMNRRTKIKTRWKFSVLFLSHFLFLLILSQLLFVFHFVPRFVFFRSFEPHFVRYKCVWGRATGFPMCNW